MLIACAMAASSPAPVFVVGMPRSGTTLLQSKLRQSGVSVLAETHWLDKWFPRWLGDGRDADSGRIPFERYARDESFERLELKTGLVRATLETTDFSGRQVLATLLRLRAEGSELERAGEKTPAHFAHVDTILDWFPSAQVVFLMRDPRAVINSLRSAPWWHGDVQRSARRWAAASQILRSYENDDRVRPLVYERLVEDPAHQLRSLWQWLGLPEGRDLIAGGARRTGGSEGLPVEDPWRARNQARLMSSIDMDSLNRWQAELSRRDRLLIEAVVYEELRLRGYESSSGRHRAARWTRVRASRFRKSLHGRIGGPWRNVWTHARKM